MSKTIDEKVVSMQFDNKHFESNVKTSMSTLDKLKEKLKFKNASDGFESINKEVKKVDMSDLSKSVDAVQAKFSALQVIGVTALANITNSAINAGKRITAALTIDPIKTGYQEYSTQLTATQSILANVASKGKSIEDVNAALDELNKYADKTIYNFTEMTKNIGYFTTAGVDLDESVVSIKGFSNAAALAGADATRTAGAMYQLSQAMSSGKMLLMDWRSLEQAGIGGEKFRDAIIETARVHGIAIDEMIESEGSFRDTLKDGWLTNDIMTESLEKFTMTTEGLTDAEIEANRERWRSIGYTEEQIDGIFELGKVATDSAEKVKTLSQMWDVLKEAAQSGWAQTWRLIFGDLEQAKALFSPLSEYLSGIIEKISDARNRLLEGALGKSFTNLVESISSTTKPISKAVNALANYGEVVDKIINGDFGNGEYRFRKLTEAGYDWMHTQNLVNEKLGDSTRYATEYSEAQSELNESQSDLIEIDSEYIASLVDMSDAQLKNIDALQELEIQADKTGIPLREFIDNIDQINGRYLLINSFKNVGEGLVKTITAIKDAWVEVFPPATSEQLYNVIAGLHKLSTFFKMADDEEGFNETADKLRRTFKGLFAALDIILTIISGPIKIALKILSKLLGAFNLDFLSATALIGDGIVKIRDFIDSCLDFTGIFQAMIPIILNAAEAIREWVSSLKDSKFVEVGLNVIKGLVNGIKSGIGNVIETVTNLGKIILEKICEVLGIHSPSTKMHEVGTNIIDGLINGIKEGAPKILEIFKNIGISCINGLKNIKWSSVFAGGVSIALIASAKKMINILDKVTSPLAGLEEVLSGAGQVLQQSATGVGKILKNTAKVVKSFSKKLKAEAFKTRAEAIKELAIAIGILAASVYLLAKLDSDKLKSAVKSIIVLSVVMTTLALVVSKLSEASATIDKKGIKINGIKTCLISMGIALLLISATVKMLGSLNPDQVTQGFSGLAACIVAIYVMADIMGKVGDKANSIKEFGKMMRRLAVALLLMVAVVKLAGHLSITEIAKGTAFIAGFLVFVNCVTNITKVTNEQKIAKVGGLLVSLSVALLLMVAVVKLAGHLSLGELLKGTAFIAGFLVFVNCITNITKVTSEQQIAKIGGLVFRLSLSLLLMVAVVKLAGQLSLGELLKGTAFIAGFLVFVNCVTNITKVTNEQKMAKVGGTILAMSVAIGIMAGVCILLSLISLPALAKGVAAVAIMGTIITGMIKATRGAQDCKANLIIMTVAIGILAAAIAALSFIDTEKLLSSAAAMSSVMLVFSLIIKAASTANKAMGSLIVMTVAVGLLAGIIYLLAQMDCGSALSSATALTELLLAMTISLKVLDGIGKAIVDSKGKTLLGIAALAAMALPLLAFVGVLACMSGIQNAIANATALTDLATVLTLLLIPLSAIGIIMFGTYGIAAIGIAALAAMALPLLAFVGVLSKMQDVQNAEQNAKLLTELLTIMTEVLMIMSVLGPLALIGIGVVSLLTGVILAIGTVAASIGALITKFPQLEQFVDVGLPLMQKLAKGIGGIIGSFVNGMISNAISELPALGESLSSFVNSVSVDSSSIAGIKDLSECIKLLGEAWIEVTKAGFLDIGDNNLVKFGKQLGLFGDSLGEFATKTEHVRPIKIQAASEAAKLLTEIANEIPSDFLNNNLINFGKQVSAFGESLGTFANNVSDVDPTKIKSATESSKILVETAKEIPSDFGNNNLINLGSQLAGFAESLKTFGEKTADIKPIKIKSAAEAGKSLAETAKEIPTDIGNNNLINIGTQLDAFGKSLSTFSSNIADVKPERITSAAEAGKELALAAKEIPTDFRNNNLINFGKQLPTFGANLGAFANNVEDVDPEKITAASNAAKSLSEIAGEISSKDLKESKITEISNYIKEFGSAISDFATSISNETFNPEIMSAAASSSEQLIAAISKMPGLTDETKDFKIDKISDFSTKLKDFGSGISDFASSVSEIDAERTIAAADAGTKIVNAIRTMASNTEDSDNNYLTDFSKIDLSGFAEQLNAFGKGITSFASSVNGEKFNADKAISAAEAGRKIIEAIRTLSPDTEGSEDNYLTEFSKIDFTTFSDQLTSFGNGIKSFYNEIGSVEDGINTDAIASAAEAGKNIVETIREMNSSEIDFKDIKLDDFASQLEKFGEGISSFANKIGEVTVDFNTAISAAEAGRKIIEVISEITDETGEALEKTTKGGSNAFVERLKALGESISEFSKKITEVNTDQISKAINAVSAIKDLKIPEADTIESTTKSIKELINLFKEFSGLTDDTVSGFEKNMSKLGEAGIKGIIDAFKIPNESVTSAINEFLASVSSSVIDYEETIMTDGKELGSNLVDGFVAGISENTFKVEAQASAMAKAAVKSANEELDVNSPSKVFMKTGSSVVEGFVKGIAENLGDVNKSAITLGSTMLNATQSYLKINSPSIVFKNEVGRYIVQGIAEGITSDMSAEEAAEKKAQNIVNAFKKELDKNDLDTETAEKEFELWTLKDGKNASQKDITAKQLKLYNDNLTRAVKQQQLAYDEWRETCVQLGDNSEYAQEAWNKYLDSQIEVQNIHKNIADVTKENAEYEKELNEELIDTKYEVWKAQHNYASEEEKAAKETEYYNEKLKIATDNSSKSYQKYVDKVKQFGEESVDAKEAFKTYLEDEKEIADIQIRLMEIIREAADRRSEEFEDRRENRDYLYKLWQLKNDDATDKQKDDRALKYYADQLADNADNRKRLQNKAFEAAMQYGKQSDVYDGIVKQLQELDLKDAEARKNIRDIKKNALERENEELKESLNAQSEAADLKYQIWEKTYGRKATAMQKSVTKLALLNEQVITQSKMLEVSRKDYLKAVDDYGKSSNEAQSAYNDFLREQLELANLQSDIADLNEATVEREKNARSDYKKYMERYKDYYLKNGMTLEDLEKDARLTSGYDPNNAVTSMLDKTGKAINDITSNSKYKDIVSGFSNIGTSYADAVNTGVEGHIPTLVDTTTSMIEQCTNAIKEQKSKWISAGHNLVYGLIEGIKEYTSKAIEAAKELAKATTEAANTEFGIASPSKAFAEIGMYAVSGLAKGLIENSKLSEEASSVVGDNVIDNLRNTIKRISDIANSDIDTQPTIRPVLDLSDVESGTARLNALFSRSQAIRINAGMQKHDVSDSQNGNNSNNGNTYQFTQNNYSPKALSRNEIYRQTRNQFTAMKEALK